MQDSKYSPASQRSRWQDSRQEDISDEFNTSTKGKVLSTVIVMFSGQSSRSEIRSTRSISPIRKNDNPSDYSSILKPIMLLDIDERGIIKINRSALEYIQGLNTKVTELTSPFNSKIAVLSVVGPYRTGKSFLLNRFAGNKLSFFFLNL